VAGRELTLAPGDVFSIAPNEPHTIATDGPESLRLVCLDCFFSSQA
jgi:quercetin dioxygenase-like cupin family protein